MNTLKLAMIFFVLLLTVGCISTGKKVDTTVKYNGGGVLEYTFLKQVDDTKIQISEVTRQIAKNFKKNSLFELEKSYRGEHGSAITSGFGIYSYSKNSNHYIEVKNNFKVGTYEDDNQTAIFNVDVKDVGDLYNISVHCPNEFKDKALKRKEGDFNVPQAIKNFVHLCKQRPLKITKTKYIKGEIDSKFTSEDVFANFSRILNKPYKPSKNNKETFYVKTKNLNTPVDISVFPYRGGSKTSYSFRYDYELHDGGTTTYNLEDITTLTGKITSIVNN